MGSAKKVVNAVKYLSVPIKSTIDITKNSIDVVKDLAHGDIKGMVTDLRKGTVAFGEKTIPGVKHYTEKIRDNRLAQKAASKNAALQEQIQKQMDMQRGRQSVSNRENQAEVDGVLNAEAHRLSTSTILTEAGGVDPHLLNLHRGNKLG